MGYTFDSAGTPIIAATPTQTVVDMQAIVAFAKKYANMRVGTASDRSLLPAGEVWEGLVFYETDTDITWQATSSSSWRVLSMPMTAWTPTVTGLTIGNGTLRTYYTKSDKLINFFIEFEAGSTTVATGQIGFTLPEPIADETMHRHLGEGLFRFTGGTAGIYKVEPRQAGSQVVNANILDASGASVTAGSNITNLVPTTAAWNNAAYRPTLYLHGSYRSAS